MYIDDFKDIQLHKILVPIDGSKQSFKAAAHATSLAKLDEKINLTLLYIIDMNKEVSSFEQVSLGGYIPMELKEKGYKILHELEKELIFMDKEHMLAPHKVHSVVRLGIPAEVIVDTAKAENFDCIVMGSRGLGNLKSIFLGSVSRFVLQNAHCPVCIVR